MVWTVLALALWVVLGGFISYYGDLQGRRWGKRRVSWLGMRPKHTAIFITSLTGGFIALFSVVSLMIIVPTVRDVVTHGENAIQENKRLIADEKKQQLIVKADRERLDRENRLKQQENDRKLADGQRELAGLQAQLLAARARLAPLQAQIDRQKIKVAALQARQEKLQTTKKRLGIQIASQDARNKKLEAANLALDRENTKLDLTNRDLDQANKKAHVSNDEFYNSNRAFVAENNKLINNNASLEANNSKLANDKAALEAQLADLAHQKEEVIGLIHQRDQLTEQIAREYTVLRQGYVILRAGVELGRISMDAHLRPEAIKKQVDSLISTASDHAKKFGAAAGENGLAATMPRKQRYTLTGYEYTDGDAQVNALAQDWSGSDRSYVVVANTVNNCLAGEPADIELHRYPVVRVFAKGAEVASRSIDGNSKVEVIIENLMAFLQKDVQKSALQAGIIPKVDPETGVSEVGVLGTAELFRLTDTVHRMRGPLVLTARTKQDVSSADSLDLNFRVSRLSAQPQAVATD